MKKLLLLGALLSTSAYSNCLDVDLSKNKGPAENIKIEPQGDYGTCYANASVINLDIFKNRTGVRNDHRSSVFHALAVYTSKYKKGEEFFRKEAIEDSFIGNSVQKKIFESGSPLKTLLALRESNLCDATVLQQKLLFGRMYAKDSFSDLYWIDQEFKRYKESKEMAENLSGSKLRKQKKVQSKSIKEIVRLLRFEEQNKLSFMPSANKAKNYIDHSESSMEFISKYLSDICVSSNSVKNNLASSIVYNLDASKANGKNRGKLEQKIDKILEQGSSIVASTCSNALKFDKAKHLENVNGTLKCKATYSTGQRDSHSVNIIGSRNKRGTCQYKVYDSGNEMRPVQWVNKSGMLENITSLNTLLTKNELENIK